MRYLSKYIENKNEFDINFAIAKIKDEFSKEKFSKMLEKEILEWSDKDWYMKNNNGEAEDVIISQIINWFESKYYTLTRDNELELIDEIKKELI